MSVKSKCPDTKHVLDLKTKTPAERAEALHGFGFTVLPLKANAKSPPLAKGWQNWHNDSQNNPRDLWLNNPDGNIAIATGDSFLVLDFDKKKHGRESYLKLTAIEERLPSTFTVATPGGGYHVYLRSDRGFSIGSNVLDDIGYPGVDLRANGGYVVAPGSTIDGKTYEALNSLPIAPAPQWLIDILSTKPSRAKSQDRHIASTELDTDVNVAAVIDYLIHDAEEAIEGAGGDDTTFRVACWVRDLGVSEPTALELLLEHWNDTKAFPPWDPDDLSAKVAHAYDYGQNRPGTKALTLPQNEFPPLPEEIIAVLAAQPKPHIALKSESPTSNPQGSRAKSGIINIERWQNVTESTTQWLVDGIIPQNGLAAMYGQPGSYKSFAALHLAATVASRTPFLGRKTDQTTKDVIYLAAEGGSGLRKRLDAIERIHQIQPNNVGFIRHPLDFRSNLAHLDALLATIKTENWQPALIVIDTLARTFGGGNENSSEDMGAFINIVDHLRTRTKAAILIVHHSGKDTAKGMRGHSALFGAVDSELEVEKIRNAPATGEGVGGGRLKVTKQKDGPDGFVVEYAVERVVFSDPGSAREEFGPRAEGAEGAEGAEDSGVPAQASESSSLAIREWKVGEARAVSVSEVKLSAGAHGALGVLKELCREGGGEARADAWKRAVMRRNLFSHDAWASVRRELKAAGAFSVTGTRSVVLGEVFAETDAGEAINQR